MSIEAMKQALEALEKMVTPRNFQTHQFCQKAYNDLRQAIAEAEKQEPVAWMDKFGKIHKYLSPVSSTDMPLYTTPQQRSKT